VALASSNRALEHGSQGWLDRVVAAGQEGGPVEAADAAKEHLGVETWIGERGEAFSCGRDEVSLGGARHQDPGS
jgi:hypothetical protein